MNYDGRGHRGGGFLLDFADVSPFAVAADTTTVCCGVLFLSR